MLVIPGMSRVAELLAKKRQAQIAAMCGEVVDTTDVDAQLAEIEPPKAPEPQPYSGARLYITKHAWVRMGQRGMKVRDLYAIWHYGDRVEQPNGRSAHIVTEQTCREAPEEHRDRMRRLLGATIVVEEPNEDGHCPAVMTVLAFGRDTRVVGREA